MIKFNITGVEEIVDSMRRLGADLPATTIDKAIVDVAAPIATALKQNYAAEGHKKTGELINSIQLFQRKRKGKKDTWFTWYVGPKYGGGKFKTSAAGNAAHLLEYGVIQWPVADKSKGGVRMRKATYGAVKTIKIPVGGQRIKPFGTIRRTYDQNLAKATIGLEEKVTNAILYHFSEQGFPTFTK